MASTQQQEEGKPEYQDNAPTQQQEGDYEEMDLTPYEEDDDATLHKKLVAAKMARKRAEEDLKLLCNRIGLLKQEEGKVCKLLLSDRFRLCARSTRLESARRTSCCSGAATSSRSRSGSTASSNASTSRP